MDERLRRLERRAAQGDEAAEAELLLGKLRRGDVSARDVELLAYVGDPLAAQALRLEAPTAVEDLRLWVGGLAQWDPWLPARAALVAARSGLGVIEADVPQDPRPRWALEAAEACLRQPDAETCGHAFMAAAAAFDSRQSAGAGPAHWAACAAQTAAELVAKTPEFLAGAEGHPLSHEVNAALDVAARAAGGEEPVRAAIEATLQGETRARAGL